MSDKQWYLEKERYIFRAFLNFDVILYIFRDIKEYLKNLFTRKVVLYNCKYFNEYSIKYENFILKGSGEFFLIFTNSTNSFYRNITVKGLFSQYRFAV